MKKKQVTIVTIPLVYYHGALYWGLFDQHKGPVRDHLRRHPTGGKQIPFAFKQAIESGDEILVIVDDKFTFEKAKGLPVPNEDAVISFLDEHPLPQVWFESLMDCDAWTRVVMPPVYLVCTPYSFSEKLLLSHSNNEHGLPGECANEWTDLLLYLAKEGYESIVAYIPKACMLGICYATPYAREAGIWRRPIHLNFTSKDNVVLTFEHD